MGFMSGFFGSASTTFAEESRRLRQMALEERSLDTQEVFGIYDRIQANWDEMGTVERHETYGNFADLARKFRNTPAVAALGSALENRINESMSPEKARETLQAAVTPQGSWDPNRPTGVIGMPFLERAIRVLREAGDPDVDAIEDYLRNYVETGETNYETAVNLGLAQLEAGVRLTQAQESRILQDIDMDEERRGVIYQELQLRVDQLTQNLERGKIELETLSDRLVAELVELQARAGIRSDEQEVLNRTKGYLIQQAADAAGLSAIDLEIAVATKQFKIDLEEANAESAAQTARNIALQSETIVPKLFADLINSGRPEIIDAVARGLLEPIFGEDWEEVRDNMTSAAAGINDRNIQAAMADIVYTEARTALTTAQTALVAVETSEARIRQERLRNPPAKTPDEAFKVLRDRGYDTPQEIMDSIHESNLMATDLDFFTRKGGIYEMLERDPQNLLAFEDELQRLGISVDMNNAGSITRETLQAAQAALTAQRKTLNERISMNIGVVTQYLHSQGIEASPTMFGLQIVETPSLGWVGNSNHVELWRMVEQTAPTRLLNEGVWAELSPEIKEAFGPASAAISTRYAKSFIREDGTLFTPSEVRDIFYAPDANIMGQIIELAGGVDVVRELGSPDANFIFNNVFMPEVNAFYRLYSELSSKLPYLRQYNLETDLLDPQSVVDSYNQVNQASNFLQPLLEMDFTGGAPPYSEGFTFMSPDERGFGPQPYQVDPVEYLESQGFLTLPGFEPTLEWKNQAYKDFRSVLDEAPSELRNARTLGSGRQSAQAANRELANDVSMMLGFDTGDTARNIALLNDFSRGALGAGDFMSVNAFGERYVDDQKFANFLGQLVVTLDPRTMESLERNEAALAGGRANREYLSTLFENQDMLVHEVINKVFGGNPLPLYQAGIISVDEQNPQWEGIGYGQRGEIQQTFLSGRLPEGLSIPFYIVDGNAFQAALQGAFNDLSEFQTLLGRMQIRY
jgi:hypothetical protein